MKKTLSVVFLFTLLSALLLAACGGAAATQASGVPADYQGKKNPVAGDAAAAEAGKGIYDVNCTSCHGPMGKGDGPAAAGLEIKPKDLAAVQASLADDFVFWRISEGGLNMNPPSSMPAWKAVLSEDQIWQLVMYLRVLAK
jgi:mono/diheme cytochrome c family protein